MKKFALTAVAALAIAAFSSCDEFTLPNPPAQSNSPEAVFNAEDFVVTNLVDGQLNLATALADNTQPELLKYSVKNVPADRRVKFLMQVSKTEDFATYAEVVPVTGEDSIVRVSVYDFMEAYNAAITRNPEPTTVHIRYAAYISNNAGTENVRIGGPDVWYGVSTVALTPANIAHEIEEAYYLVNSYTGWEIGQAIKLSKTVEGNPYDEPEFYLPFEVWPNTDAFSWAIIPESVFKAGTTANGVVYVGTPGVSDLKGNLVETEDMVANALTVPNPGSYMLKVNMYDLTFDISLAYETLYVNAQGYYTQFDRMLRLYTNDYVNYDGVIRTTGNFRLYAQPTSNGICYAAAEGDVPATEGVITTGKLANYASAVDTPALHVPATGVYYVMANIVELSWKAVQMQNVSLVGSFNGWNVADEAATMKVTGSTPVYTIKGVTLDEGGEFKFCVNHSWDYSFGGAIDHIVQNGGNLAVPEGGVYDITLNFTTVPYSVTLVKK